MFSSNVHWVFSKDIRIQDKKIEKQKKLSDLTSYTRCHAIPFSFQLLSYDLLPQPCTSMLSCFRLLASASISAPWLAGGLAHKSSPWLLTFLHPSPKKSPNATEMPIFSLMTAHSGGFPSCRQKSRNSWNDSGRNGSRALLALQHRALRWTKAVTRMP